MNMKKIVLIGAVVLVVLGCVIAAGCTSTPTTQQTGTGDALSLPGGEGDSNPGIEVDSAYPSNFSEPDQNVALDGAQARPPR